jgi:hypothetical protein
VTWTPRLGWSRSIDDVCERGCWANQIDLLNTS